GHALGEQRGLGPRPAILGLEIAVELGPWIRGVPLGPRGGVGGDEVAGSALTAEQRRGDALLARVEVVRLAERGAAWVRGRGWRAAPLGEGREEGAGEDGARGFGEASSGHGTGHDTRPPAFRRQRTIT